MADSELSSINSLQPNQKATTLALKVLRQGSSLFSKASSKPIRKIIFLDEEGTMIYGIIFATAIPYFHDQLKFNRSYLISNPDIREINKNFPNINPNIELVLQTNTTITATENIINCSNNTFSFFEFEDIKKTSQDAQPLDVIGVVMKVKQSIQFRRDDKSIGCRREVILINLIHDTITINLWDDLAFNEGQWLEEMGNEKSIIAFSNMKTQPYQETVHLKSIYTTTIVQNPPCTESDNLKIWLDSGFKDHNLDDLWLDTKLKDSKEITIKQLIEERKKLTENVYYSFKGCILEVENILNPWYEACNNCSRAVIKAKDATTCRKCVHILVESMPRYRVTINVGKNNENVRITMFEDVAAAFIGCPVKDFIKSITEDASASPYYMALEMAEKEEYIFLFKFTEKTQINNATFSIIAEGFRKPLQKLDKSGHSTKTVSNHSDKSWSATKKGQATKSRSKKRIEPQKMEDGNAHIQNQIEDDEKIATFIKTKNINQSPTFKSRSQQNKKQLDDGAKGNTQIMIEDDDKISSFTKRKRQVKTKNDKQKVASLKIKQEKL